MKRSQIIYIAVTLILALAAKSQASVFVCNGKEVKKGQAMITLVKDPSAVCTKTDRLQLDLEKGTLKNVKAASN